MDRQPHLSPSSDGGQGFAFHCAVSTLVHSEHMNWSPSSYKQNPCPLNGWSLGSFLASLYNVHPHQYMECYFTSCEYECM